MHPYIELAWQAIETYLATGQTITPPDPIPADMARPGVVFVSLHRADGKLRGCRGTIRPTEPTLADAIIKTAIASATDDPRFQPVVLGEMPGMKLKVDVLSPLEPVTALSQLDEKIYGVLMQSAQHRALLLPDIAAVDSVPHQLELVRRKAGIGTNEPVELYRFTVTRYE